MCENCQKKNAMPWLVYKIKIFSIELFNVCMTAGKEISLQTLWALDEIET